MKALKKSGFTLVEIMIAVAIVGVTVIAVFNTVNYHADIAYEQTVSTRMLLLAKEKISEMETTPQNSKGVIEGTDFTYENLVNNTKNNEIIELKTTVSRLARQGGDNKTVVLNELVVRKEKAKN
ncbi:MAG: prepilin-type N-terminal cleavage/methylation domain-containing protein [Nitrospirota bacterium]